jgi:hypothetical protein
MTGIFYLRIASHVHYRKECLLFSIVLCNLFVMMVFEVQLYRFICMFVQTCHGAGIPSVLEVPTGTYTFGPCDPGTPRGTAACGVIVHIPANSRCVWVGQCVGTSTG